MTDRAGDRAGLGAAAGEPTVGASGSSAARDGGRDVEAASS